MRKNKRIILLILLLASGSFLNAQRVKLIEGDLGSVRAEKTFNLEFRYDSLSVGKFHNEQDFVNKKIAERNKKHPGDGDAWAKSWVDQRKEAFEPRFTSEFERSSGKKSSASSKYTLVFHTTFIEPGFSTSGILIHKNPELAGEIFVVETDNRSRIIARLSMEKVIGQAGSHFETGENLDGAYGEAGMLVGSFVNRN